MKKGDTRGLSTIITTLLIILLVIVAVAILWGVIRSVITKNAESISLGKFTIDLEIVSIRQTPQDVNIKVQRNPGGGELEGIIFSIFDGEETHIYEKRDVDLEELEIKTFVVDYQGNIVSVSIYPLFLSDSGKIITGDVSDTYYLYNNGGSGGEGGYIDPNCTIHCEGKVCGDNGCGGSCGSCSGSTPYCILGTCQASGGGEGDCTCAASTCIGTTCDDGLGGSCSGELQPDCTNEFGYPIMCGISENGCGQCGSCDEGWHCFDGTCQEDCTVNCDEKECGDNGCGGVCGYCEILYGTGYNCNSSGLCEACIPDCLEKECGDNGCEGTCGDCNTLYNLSYNCNISNNQCEMCTPNCIDQSRECGPVPNGCGESCGNCSELYGYPENSCTNGICIPPEVSLNNGTVLSVWPYPEGRMLFDSEDLPISPTIDYTGYYVRFPGSSQIGCMLIYDFVTPIPLASYDKSYMKISEDPTTVDIEDYYEVWRTREGCCNNYLCEGL